MTGTWASYWSHTNGLKEGNNFGFSNCDDLHVGWWIFCEGKHRNLLKSTFKFFLNRLQIKLRKQLSS